MDIEGISLTVCGCDPVRARPGTSLLHPHSPQLEVGISQQGSYGNQHRRRSACWNLDRNCCMDTILSALDIAGEVKARIVRPRASCSTILAPCASASGSNGHIYSHLCVYTPSHPYYQGLRTIFDERSASARTMQIGKLVPVKTNIRERVWDEERSPVTLLNGFSRPDPGRADEKFLTSVHAYATEYGCNSTIRSTI